MRRAAALLQSLSEADPTRKEAYLWLGHARAELQDWTAAREAYKKYVDRAPKDIDGLRGIARTYEGEGKKDLALLWYRNALEVEPGNERLRQAIDQLEAGGASPAQPPAAPEKPGFWDEGVAGRLGARSVGWGRALAVVIFSIWLLNGAHSGTRLFQERMPNMPAGFVTFNYAVSTLLLYIVYWGIPTGFEWALMAFSIMAGVIVVRATFR